MTEVHTWAKARRMSIVLVVSLGAMVVARTARRGSNVSPRPLEDFHRRTPKSGLRSSSLTLAIFSVTDVVTGNTATVTDHTVSLDGGCGNSTTFLCLKLGGSDSFTVTVSSPLKASQAHTTPASDWAMTLRVGGKICGEFQTSSANIPPGYVGGFFQDQFDFTQSTKTLNRYAAQITCTNSDVSITGTIALNAQNTTPGEGYYLYDNRGNTYGFGNDSYLTYLGSPGFLSLNAPIVSMATTPSGGGYWMTGSDGGVFAYGNARFFGSTGNIRLNKPIVGMAATADGGGYWFVASDGGVFAYGDARFHGSMGSSHLNQPIVGMTATPDGGGYWLVAADGGVFAFGDAGFFGSTGNIHLNKPIVGMTSTTDGKGYWFVAADGGVFAYGDARFFGSTGSITLNEPITGILSTSDDGGYLMVATDGGLFAFGDAPFFGSLGGLGITGVVGAVP